jgi:hypothetical protein
MAFKTFCDICNKEIIGGSYSTRGDYEHKYYCKICWLDKKNWPKIHKVNKNQD